MAKQVSGENSTPAEILREHGYCAKPNRSKTKDQDNTVHETFISAQEDDSATNDDES
jgi:hypothetical protein